MERERARAEITRTAAAVWTMATVAPMISTAVGVRSGALLRTPAIARNTDTVAPNTVPVSLLKSSSSSIMSALI